MGERQKCAKRFGEGNGEPWWDRTTDPLIKSPAKPSRTTTQHDATSREIEQAG